MSADRFQIARLLRACDARFVPPLSRRVDIDAYADKLAVHARLVEAWEEERLAGLVALYCDDHATRTAFITNVSVDVDHARRGIAGRLLLQAMAIAHTAGMRRIALEVDAGNTVAIALYRKHGFTPCAHTNGTTQAVRFQRDLGNDE